MKFFFLLLLLLCFEYAVSQDVSGLWRGRFTTTNLLQMELPYTFELLLFQDENKITGYSYSTSGSQDFYAVCEIKGTLYKGYMVVTEINTLYQNPPTGEGVLQKHLLFFNANDQEATGDWKQNNKKDFQLFEQTGKTFLKKEEDPTKSALIKVLEKKNIIKIEPPANRNNIKTDSVKLTSRPTEIIKTIETYSDSLVLELYDDGLLDADSVSVFLNNHMLLNKVALTDKALKQIIHLPTTKDEVTITMFAENEGSIPPNTGLLIIRDADKRYEIRFSSSKMKSAAILIQRK